MPSGGQQQQWHFNQEQTKETDITVQQYQYTVLVLVYTSTTVPGSCFPEKMGDLRPMAIETRCCKVFFPNYSKKKAAEDTLVPPLWGKRKKVFFGLFVHTAVRGGTCAFTLKIVNRLIKNSSGRVLTLSQPLGTLGMEQFLWYPH